MTNSIRLVTAAIEPPQDYLKSAWETASAY
jgi:hypothetical protein